MKRQRPTKEGGAENKRRKLLWLSDDVWMEILKKHFQVILWDNMRYHDMNWFMYDESYLYQQVNLKAAANVFNRFLQKQMPDGDIKIYGIHIYTEEGGDRLIRAHGSLEKEFHGSTLFNSKRYNTVCIKNGCNCGTLPINSS